MNTTQRIAVTAASLVAALLSSSILAHAQNADVTVIVNGQTMSFDQPPVEQAGRVFVPLRSIFQQLGASVVYQNGTINATDGPRTVSLQIGSSQATVNGQPEALSAPAFVAGSRTLVPLRFVATALGASVNWNNATSTVSIASNGSGSRGNDAEYISDRWPAAGTAWHGDVIRASFTRAVRPDSVHVRIDGNDVTVATTITSHGFEFRPQRRLSPGEHRIRVTGQTETGSRFSTGWDFRS